MGTSRLKPDSSLTKVMVDDSEFYGNAVKFEKLFWSEGTLFTFVVNSPNFSDPTSLDRFENFITQLEGVKMSVGRQSTQLWVRDFIDYAKDWGVQPEDMNKEVETFLRGRSDITEHLTYRTEIVSANTTIQVPARFHFFTAYYGSADWIIRGDIVQSIIEVTEDHPELNAIFYHEMVECVDLMNYTRYSLKQTLGQSLLAIMLLMSILFLSSLDSSQLFPVIWVAASFIAINAMVVGYLCLWGVDMDVVAMICLLMTVGFSVDYTVHMAVTYARQTVVDGVPSSVRVRLALDEVARPILNSGLSTLTAVCLVTLVQSYMLRTFVKSVFLVVVFGQLQSLLVLPACFILLDNRGSKVAPVRTKRLRKEAEVKNELTNTTKL
uniref:Uncharacterized protein n=1 Tax=Plectus sambesii TaxID=2011161 RepID=A0A914V8W6_9BILA